MTRNEQIEEVVRQEIPDFAIVKKSQSKLMQNINKVAKIFNPRFMSGYTTTLYPKIYIPDDRAEDPDFWKVVAHELVHLVRAKKMGLLHTLSYGFPQILAPLGLLSIGAIWLGPWMLLNLIWLICLAPLPAYFRMREEMDAYAMSIACNYWRYGGIQQAQILWIADHFTSPDYYFMWPFEENVESRLEDIAADIESGHYDDLYPYNKIREVLKDPT